MAADRLLVVASETLNCSAFLLSRCRTRSRCLKMMAVIELCRLLLTCSSSNLTAYRTFYAGLGLWGCCSVWGSVKIWILIVFSYLWLFAAPQPHRPLADCLFLFQKPRTTSWRPSWCFFSRWLPFSWVCWLCKTSEIHLYVLVASLGWPIWLRATRWWDGCPFFSLCHWESCPLWCVWMVVFLLPGSPCSEEARGRVK